jgi:hypothetical protein
VVLQSLKQKQHIYNKDLDIKPSFVPDMKLFDPLSRSIIMSIEVD